MEGIVGSRGMSVSIEGVWTGEIYSPYGWENTGVYVLERGVILGGSNRHYSTGRYAISGNSYKAQIFVHYYGPPRAIFGEKREEFEIEVTGQVHEGVIDAQVLRPDKPDFTIQYRMTRRMDIPTG